jgi:hypothetical protein
MPRRIDRRTGLTEEQITQLVCGHDFFGDAYGQNLDQMKRDWAAHRKTIEEAARNDKLRPWAKPWAYYVFDCGLTSAEALERRDKNE